MSNKKDFGDLQNYIASNDYISQAAILLDAPLEYANAVLGKLSYVTWLKPVEWYPIDHRLKARPIDLGWRTLLNIHVILWRKKGYEIFNIFNFF